MSGKLHPRDMRAALARLDGAKLERSRADLPTVPIRPQTICQRGQFAARVDRDLLPPEPSPQFKGLMALLAGCELALVDLGVGLSMHSPAAKDFNMEKAKKALETALNDFRRSSAECPSTGSGRAGG